MPFFRKSDPVPQSIIHELYTSAVEAARQPHFYSNWNVSDSVDGRFDILCIHIFLLLRRLKDAASSESSYASQALFDLLFTDMDAQLRQMGVSDLKVGKEVKIMAKAYMGRVEAYDAGIDIPEEEECLKVLSQAVQRNVFREAQETVASKAIAYYMRAAHHALMTQNTDSILAGDLAFPDASNT